MKLYIYIHTQETATRCVYIYIYPLHIPTNITICASGSPHPWTPERSQISTWVKHLQPTPAPRSQASFDAGRFSTFFARKLSVTCGFSMFQLSTNGDLHCFIYLRKDLGVWATFFATSRGRASTVTVKPSTTMGCATGSQGNPSDEGKTLTNPQLLAVKNWTGFVQSTKRRRCQSGTIKPAMLDHWRCI